MSTETHSNSASNLEKVLKAGEFAFTGELGPPRGTDTEEVREKARFALLELPRRCLSTNLVLLLFHMA